MALAKVIVVVLARLERVKLVAFGLKFPKRTKQKYPKKRKRQ